MAKVRIKLDDDTVWIAEKNGEGNYLIEYTPEYMEYYEWKYGGGNGYPTPIDNEYPANEIEVIGSVSG